MKLQNNLSEQNSFLDVIILAAGKGTRMPSTYPKALQTLLGEAMISHVYNAVSGINAKIDLQDNISSVKNDNTNTYKVRTIWTVVGHKAQKITAHLTKEYGENASKYCVFQKEQLGTGHAVLCVLNAIKERHANSQRNPSDFQIPHKILVLNADTPLISTQVLKEFIEKSQQAPLSFMSLLLDKPEAYGRVLRSHFSSNLQVLLNSTTQNEEMKHINTGSVARIVEAKDFKKEFNQEETGAEIHEVNAGIYLFKYTLLDELLPQISTANLSGEYYLTDIVSLASEKGYPVEAFCANAQSTHIKSNNLTTKKDSNSTKNTFTTFSDKSSQNTSTALLGVNNPYELAHAETLMQKQEIERRLRDGVIIHSPDTVRISPSAVIQKGVEIFGPCEIYNSSFIGENTRIESHTYIENTAISDHCHVRSFCHFVDAHLGSNISIGPYARLRPGANLSDDVHIGNFVEIKKSTVEKGSKINHLSYIGDSQIGSGVNIGAGCITCNYDGVHKHKTTIQDNAFIGSNCALVAPVTIGKNSLIGAGSVITKDVPEDSLALARSREFILKK